MKGFETCSETRRLEGKGIFLPYVLQTLEIHCEVIQIVNSLCLNLNRYLPNLHNFMILVALVFSSLLT